jgi:phosphatidate cytidylyltransferase
VHLKRWITGLTALPFLIFFVYSGGLLFILLISFACICSLWEYYRIVFNADRQILGGALVWWGYVISFGIILATHFAGTDGAAVLVALNLVFVGLISVFIFKSNPAVIDVIQKQIQGIVYIPLLISFLVSIRNGPDGMIWIFLLLGIIFTGDTSAYYVGSYLGQRKLNPAVSPGKTVEGALGGLAGNLIAGAIGKFFFFPTLSWGLAILFFVTAGIAGQLGDLFESQLKRSSMIKDSGGILPGHGGFLDRIDALLFASPVAYLFIGHIF